MKKILSPIQLRNIKDGLHSQRTLIEMAQKLIDIHERFLNKVDQLDEIIKKKIGPKGEKPSNAELVQLMLPLIPDVRDGHTPTTDELVAIIRPLIPPAKKGDPGKDATTPKKGVHYFTEADRQEIASLAASLVRLSSTEKEIDPVAILNAIEKLPKDKRLSTRHIDGLEQTISALHNQTRQGYLHGAGITELFAGSGITLVRDSNGNYTITSTGGGVGSPIVVTGTINDTNIAFTAASSFTYVVVNGVIYRENHGFTKSGLSITIASPVGTGGDIYAL